MGFLWKVTNIDDSDPKGNQETNIKCFIPKRSLRREGFRPKNAATLWKEPFAGAKKVVFCVGSLVPNLDPQLIEVSELSKVQVV